MPELPEVETIKNLLNTLVKDRTIIAIEVRRNKTILGDVETFKNSLLNRTFLNVERKGKFLVFSLDKDLILLTHLRMEGKFYLLKEEDPDSKYAKVIFHLDQKEKLIFDDMRCFGIIALKNKNNYLTSSPLNKVAKDPLEDISSEELFLKSKKINKPIKETLMDQSIISGIGNIYADEILYACKVHPLSKTSCLPLNKWKEILESSRTILLGAIKEGGSTIKSYHPGKGINGNFQVYLKVYSHKNEPCPICGNIYNFIKISGRGTTFCPHCQLKYNHPFVIGITGKIGSGKSTVLKLFQNEGMKVFSSDEEVNKLYQDPKVLRLLEEKLSLKEETISKDIIRKHLNKHPQYIKIIESVIHPLVKESIHSFIKSNSKDKFLVIEVPLLYEANFEEIFDFIIAIDISERIQIERLNKRNETNASFLKMIYDNNSSFSKYKSKVNSLIINDGTYEELKEKVRSLINRLEESLR